MAQEMKATAEGTASQRTEQQAEGDPFPPTAGATDGEGDDRGLGRRPARARKRLHEATTAMTMFRKGFSRSRTSQAG